MKAVFGINARKIASKNIALILALVIAGTAIFIFSYPAHAFFGIGDPIAKGFVWAFGQLIQMLVGLLGTFLINLFYVLVAVANYNQFLASTAVTEGWIVMRDLVNMFFVLVLIVIAIGTILQQQQYHYSQTLPKFLVAAILVNFSKTICGILIDATQVVMMTFVGAISGALGGNIAALLGIPTLLKQVAPWRGDAAPNVEVIAFAGFFLALAFIVVSLIVVGIMVVMLVIRIVALWFLIILSPAAFFLMSLPNDRGYFSKWLDQFINYLLVGPVMMFFLWLSLTVVASQQGSGVNDATQIQIATELGINFIDEQKKSGVVDIGGPDIGGSLLGSTAIGTVGGIAGYILGICMLMATLMAAQQLSSVGGNIAGAGAGYVKDWFAGKRGPLNPFRAVRETVGGVMGRRQERRKERVKSRVERFDRALGIAQAVPAEMIKAGGKALLKTPAGQHVREWYNRDSTQTGLDTAVRFATGFTGGWGRIHQARREAKRSGLEKENMEKEATIGDHRGKAEQADREADMHMKNAMIARRDGNTTAEMAHRQDAENARNVAATHKNAAEGLENEVQWNKGQLAMDKAREIAFSGIKGAAKFLLAGATAPIGGGLLYAPGIINDVGKRGKEHARLAEEAQADDVNARAGKLKDKSKDELNVLYASATTDRDKMAINQALIQGGHADEFEVESLMQKQKGLGADPLTMNQMNQAVAQKYPLRNWALDPQFLAQAGTHADVLDEIERRVKQKIKSGELAAENMTADSLLENRDQTKAFLEVLSGPNSKKEMDKFMKQLQDKSGEDGKNARAAVAEIATEMIRENRNEDTGEINQKGLELLQIFFKAGGQLDKVLTTLDEASGEFQVDPGHDQFALDQMLGDTDLKKFVPIALSDSYYNGLQATPTNFQKPIAQSIIEHADGKMIRTMRGEATGIKGEDEGLGHVQRFYEAVGNYEKHIGAPLKTAEESHQTAQTVVQNIDNEINTVVNNTKDARDGLALATRKKYQLNATPGVAPESLINAQEEVQRFNREITRLDAQEKALRARRPAAVAQESSASVVHTIAERQRARFKEVNKEVLDATKNLTKFLQQGIPLHYAAGAPAQQQTTPPPPSTP